jgi:type IV fimbrial biogenesis protein FimT
MADARGFTLLELLATLAIVMIVLAVAVPSVTEMTRRNRLAAAHNEFLSALYLLRSEAAKRNRTMKMCRLSPADPDNCADAGAEGWESGWAIWPDVNGNDRIDADEVIVSLRQPLQGGVRLTGNGVSLVRRIAFRATGMPAGFNNGTFTVCVDGHPQARQIIISTAGRIRSRNAPGEQVC